MKRKVIQIAGSTCLISLPKDWVTHRGIKKGDELDLDEQGNKIVVSKESSISPKKIKISPEVFGNFHPNYLSAVYHMGYDDVEIIYDTQNTLSKIQQRVSSCIGYEIVNQGEDFCRIKSISNVTLNEFDQVLRKVFFLLETMSKNIFDIISEGKNYKLKETKILEVTNNKLTDFCKRVLNVRGYSEYNKITTIYTILTYLERLADEYRDICDSLMNKKTKVSKQTISDFKEVMNLFSTFHESFYKFDKERIETVFRKSELLKEHLVSRLLTVPSSEIMLMHSLINIVSCTYELSTSNFELHI